VGPCDIRRNGRTLWISVGVVVVALLNMNLILTLILDMDIDLRFAFQMISQEHINLRNYVWFTVSDNMCYMHYLSVNLTRCS